MNIGTSPMAWASCAIAASDMRGARSRGKVMRVLREASAPLTIKQIAALAGMSYFSVHRALERLQGLHVVSADGARNSRVFSLRAAEGQGSAAA